MGKDIQGIERGKCGSGECDDFVRSDGATCGYCGCLPTRHSKKDARSSSDSVLRHQEDGTSDAGTSGSASPEKWKDEDLVWFPSPKGEYAEFCMCCIGECRAKSPGGGDSHMKVTGMLVVSLRVVNCRFWSHLGC